MPDNASMALQHDEDGDKEAIVRLLPTLSGLQYRYAAERLLCPDDDPVEIMQRLKVPVATAYQRWSFPAEVESALVRSSPGVKNALARAILEANAPKAALRLVDAMGSENERIALSAATKVLETQGIGGGQSQRPAEENKGLNFTLNIGRAEQQTPPAENVVQNVDFSVSEG